MASVGMSRWRPPPWQSSISDPSVPSFRGHIRLESYGAHERLRDQTTAFRLPEKLTRPFDIASGRNPEEGSDRNARESRSAIDVIEHAFPFAAEIEPIQ